MKPNILINMRVLKSTIKKGKIIFKNSNFGWFYTKNPNLGLIFKNPNFKRYFILKHLINWWSIEEVKHDTCRHSNGSQKNKTK